MSMSKYKWKLVVCSRNYIKWVYNAPPMNVGEIIEANKSESFAIILYKLDLIDIVVE